MLLRTLGCLLVLAGVALPTSLANSTPKAGSPGTVAWVEHVLSVEAPALDDATRLTVAEAIVEHGTHHGVDPAVVLGVMSVESAFNPGAVSPRGARGLMQVMPHVARSMTHGAATPASLLDPVLNIQMGTGLLADLMRRHGTLPRALAAYNMGSVRLNALLKTRDAPESDLEWRYTRTVMDEVERLQAAYPSTLLAVGAASQDGVL